MDFLTRLLAGVLLLSVFVRSAPIDGKENVFDYQISIGKETGGPFKPGFIIDTKVIVRRHSDNTYNLQITNVEVRSQENETIDKEKYALLETKLKIPFDYNPSGGDSALTVYAPETKDCESVNIKRGLINVLEFYDSNAKTISKIFNISSSEKLRVKSFDWKSSSDNFRMESFSRNTWSGKLRIECEETVTKDFESDTEINLIRTLDLSGKCDHFGDQTSERYDEGKHHRTSYFPSGSKDATTIVMKSKDGSNTPKILIKSSERVRLQSVLLTRVFDEMSAKTVLQLKEVRDATPEVTPSGFPSQSSTELTLPTKQLKAEEQPNYLTEARELFKKLKESLKKLDSNPDLEDQEAASVIIDLYYTLKSLKKDSIMTLYKELNDELKTAFFEILGLASTENALDAVKDILLEKFLEANNVTIYDQAASFYENIDGKEISEKGKELLLELLPKLQSVPASSSRDRLRNAIALKSAAIQGKKCLYYDYIKDCISKYALGDTKLSFNLKDTHEKILVIRLIEMLQMYSHRIAWLLEIVSDKANPVNLRVEAILVFRQLWKTSEDVTKAMTLHFYDRTDDHEIRIYALMQLIHTDAEGSIKHLQYLVDNQDNEDRQLVSFTFSYLEMKANQQSFPNTAMKLFYDKIKHMSEKLGPKDIFDSAVYHFPMRTKGFTMNVIASKTDILPQSIFMMFQDPLQTQEYTIHTVSDGVIYNNIANIKALHDKSEGATNEPNAAVKDALENIFTKVKGSPTNTSFSFIMIEKVNWKVNSIQYFDSPQAVIQKLMSATQGSEKFIRSFKMYNHFISRMHTESGLPVNFKAAQAVVTSLEVPQFSIGYTSSKTGIPISFKYSYKFASKATYASVAQLPESRYTYATGKIGAEVVHVPQNVTLSVQKKKVDQLDYLTLKGKSNPLSDSAEKDIFLKSLEAFEGNLDSRGYQPLVKKTNTALESTSHGQDIFGFGVNITKSEIYSRPSMIEDPLTPFSFNYQEIEDNPDPFFYKIAFTKSPESRGTIEYTLTAITGHKSGQFVNILGLTLDDPKDPAAKSLRVVLGHRVNTSNPDKQAVSLNYENAMTKVFIQVHTVINMPDNKLRIPDVVKSSDEWSLAYPSEKITLTGKSIFESSGRQEVGEDDVHVLLNGLDDDKLYAESHAEFYRTDQQIERYSFAQDDNHCNNPFAKMIAETRTEKRSSIKAWDKLLKFYGYKVEGKFKKTIPEEINNLHRKIKTFLINRYSNFSSFDASLKTDENMMKISMNSSLLDETTSLMIQDKTGATIIKKFKSKIIPLLQPSSSPIKIFYHNTLNQQICSVDSSRIESFDGESIPSSSNSDCDFLLTSNCNGVKNMAITYNKKEDTFTVLYERHKIVVSKSGFCLDDVDQEDKNGLVKLVDNIALLSYKGLLAVKLPNEVWLIRERDSGTAYIKASRLFRGRLCGLCGRMTGDKRQDRVENVNDFAVSGSMCLAQE